MRYLVMFYKRVSEHEVKFLGEIEVNDEQTLHQGAEMSVLGKAFRNADPVCLEADHYNLRQL